MKNRIVIINSCKSCHFFDYEYYDWIGVCSVLDRKIEQSEDLAHWPIPADCPLEETDKKISEI